MLNNHLPDDEIQSDLSDFLQSFNFIFAILEPEREVSLYQDKRLLANLHHSMNIEKYGLKTFRQKLLAYAPNKLVLEFARARNMNVTFEEALDGQFRKNIASFQWGNNNDTKNFVKIFGYPEYLIPNSDKLITPTEVVKPSEEPFKQLKKFQAEVVFVALDESEIPNSRFLIHMPTGGGKTRVAMEVVSHFLNKGGRQVIWLADKEELCEQAMESFLHVWSHIGKHDLKICRMWGNVDIVEEMLDSEFIVAMYQKISSQVRNRDLTIKPNMIVPDEAHSVIAKTYSEIINELKDRRLKQTRVMGLTATPGRGSGRIEDNEKLAEFFNENIIEISAEEGAINHLQRKKILSKCVRCPLNTDIVYTFSPSDWRELANNFGRDFPKGVLEKIANDEKRNVKIIIRLEELAKECKRILVFCGSKKQSKILSGIMTTRKYASAHVDGFTPKEYREDMVNKFRKGEIQMIFNYGVFTAGLDVPMIDAVVIARPTTSVVLYGQMIGRGMRGTDMGGTESFQLIDVVDNILTGHDGLDNVYEYFSEYWS